MQAVNVAEQPLPRQRFRGLCDQRPDTYQRQTAIGSIDRLTHRTKHVVQRACVADGEAGRARAGLEDRGEDDVPMGIADSCVARVLHDADDFHAGLAAERNRLADGTAPESDGPSVR